jgi:heme-degrading monooxygenase HmoA
MIVRIVKLQVRQDRLCEFEEKFRTVRDKIASFKGCKHVELLDVIGEPGTVFTYSLWESEDSLEEYRRSDLFGTTWNDVKKLFNGKPEAWSLRSHDVAGSVTEKTGK